MTLTSHTKLLSINKTWDYKGDGGFLKTKKTILMLEKYKLIGKLLFNFLN